MNILELQTEIKDTKRKLFELETKLNTYPNFTLMYLLNKGKHTFVLQHTKQVPNLETNGWKKWTIEEFTTFIIDKTSL